MSERPRDEPDEALTPHVFEPGEPIHADEHGDHEASIDVTEWCKRCGWHLSHAIHLPAVKDPDAE